jgi:glucose-1-phosphate adenylyltransferase
MYRMDYRTMAREHLESDADLTLAVMPCSEGEVASFGCVRVDEDGRILEFREKPKDAAARAGMEVPPQLLARLGMNAGKPFLASMGIYLFWKPILRDCLGSDFRDFGQDVIPETVRRLKVRAHFFHGYWRDIGTIRSFYDAHMDLVRPDAPFDFYDSEWAFYTHPRFLPGARLNACRFNRCILADGSSLDECTAEDSIIGVRATVRRATLRRCLVMGADADAPDGPPGAPPIGIGEGSLIQDAIVDKNARIGRGVRLVNKEGTREAEGDGWVIREGIIVVPKNAVVPDATTV